MKTSTQQYVELPRIKRAKNSWERKVIHYLVTHPSGKSSPELAMEAIASYWLIEALENNVAHEEIIIASRNANEKLEAKVAIIRKIVGLQTTIDSPYTYIKNEPNIYVELPRIKKIKDSWSGKVIQYLLKHPSGTLSTDLAMDAIVYYWLVEALENNVERSELVKASRMATEMLEAKLATITRMLGIQAPQPTSLSEPTASYVVNVMEQESDVGVDEDKDEQDEDEDEDEDWSDFLDDQTRMLANVLGG
ncbi:MAG: hypothetical protein KME40_33870 [Komarekiella atlantica HA4396-MV6]|jgi:hypothetical protein|nr:hypothetical protein [Komarekiella atlantica HA4396-MV6]